MHIIMDTTMTTNTAMHTITHTTTQQMVAAVVAAITHTAMPKGRFGKPAGPSEFRTRGPTLV